MARCTGVRYGSRLPAEDRCRAESGFRPGCGWIGDERLVPVQRYRSQASAPSVPRCNTEVDGMAQMTGQNGVMMVSRRLRSICSLHQRCRYRQERETLDERQRLYQRQPGLC